jgi:hypothetical protein
MALATNYYTKYTVAGVDVTAYIEEAPFTDTALERVDSLKIIFTSAITDTGVALTPGSEITIQRGSSASTLIYIFRGYITENAPETVNIAVTCVNKLWSLKQRQVNKSFDKAIDTEAGKLSSMILTLLTTYGGLNADSSTIQDSGTAFTLNKYICVNDEVFERTMKLVDALGWQLYYNPQDDKVYCEEYGFRSYANTVKFGLSTSNVQMLSVPKLKYDYKNLINKVTINGAKQLDTKLEEFDGTGSQVDFTLAFTPLETKVTVSGVLKVRGIKGGDTTAFDYWVEEDLKLVTFVSAPGSGTNNVDVEYSAMVPIPVVLDDSESIELYCPTNPTTGEKTPFHKTITYTDIIDIDDAINRGTEYLATWSTPFVDYTMEIDQSNALFFPGQKVNIEDDVNGFTGELVVNEILRNYPLPSDVIRLTDNRNFINSLNDITDRLGKLEKEALRNVGTLVHVKSFKTVPETYENRYVDAQKNLVSGLGMIWGSSQFGTWGVNKWSTSINSTDTIVRRIPGNGVFSEYLYDNTFVDTVNSTETVNTTDREITARGGGGILFPGILQSLGFYSNDKALTGAGVTVQFTGGSMRLWLGSSAALGTPPTNWVELTNMVTNVEKTGVLTGSGDWLYYKILKDPSTTIATTKNDHGHSTVPAIQIRNITEAV